MKHYSTVGIRYSMRDLLSGINNWVCLTRKLATCVNDVSVSSGINSPLQAVNSMYKRSFRWRFI